MIVAICMARNEADVIGRNIDHLLTQGVDRVVVEDGTSTDETYAIALEHGAIVLRETDRAYDQGARMTRLAADWCDEGDWCIPFDADEFWYATEGGSIRHALEQTTADKCFARMFLHRDWEHRAAHPKPLPKVAFRWTEGARIAFGNHDVIRTGPDAWGVLDLREWQNRSWEHFCAKVERQRELVAHTPHLGVYGSHMTRLVGLSETELRAEWDALQAGEWLFDPIPAR